MEKAKNTSGAGFSPANLPLGENGYFEIRMESVGGLGANLCAKLLGELGAVELGLNAAVFSSYGSEKRGSPVKSYVRFSVPPTEILHNSPVERPRLLVLFSEALSSTLPVTAGVGADATIVINSKKTPREVRDALRLHAGRVCCVDALGVALESKSRVNMVMLGAIAAALDFLPLDAVKAVVTRTLGKKYPAALESNLKGLSLGFSGLVCEDFADDGRFPEVPFCEISCAWGYENAPLGGANPLIGSTVSNDLSPSREGFIPLFFPEKCIHCGLCDSTCPDMVFQFLPGEYRGKPAMLNSGLDYLHCKGCLRCVEICPTEALVAGVEAEHEERRHFMRNKDLIAEDITLDPAGPSAWVTGEAYLTEKRVDGGLA